MQIGVLCWLPSDPSGRCQRFLYINIYKPSCRNCDGSNTKTIDKLTVQTAEVRSEGALGVATLGLECFHISKDAVC